MCPFVRSSANKLSPVLIVKTQKNISLSYKAIKNQNHVQIHQKEERAYWSVTLCFSVSGSEENRENPAASYELRPGGSERAGGEIHRRASCTEKIQAAYLAEY